MLVGYARVSTDDWMLALQCDALRAASYEKICTDPISGAKAERPGGSSPLSPHVGPPAPSLVATPFYSVGLCKGLSEFSSDHDV
jgi:hypothetical protein